MYYFILASEVSGEMYVRCTHNTMGVAAGGRLWVVGMGQGVRHSKVAQVAGCIPMPAGVLSGSNQTTKRHRHCVWET